MLSSSFACELYIFLVSGHDSTEGCLQLCRLVVLTANVVGLLFCMQMVVVVESVTFMFCWSVTVKGMIFMFLQVSSYNNGYGVFNKNKL